MLPVASADPVELILNNQPASTFQPQPQTSPKQSSYVPPPPGSRPCSVCKNVHLSCDRQRPCSRCVRLGYVFSKQINYSNTGLSYWMKSKDWFILDLEQIHWQILSYWPKTNSVIQARTRMCRPTRTDSRQTAHWHRSSGNHQTSQGKSRSESSTKEKHWYQYGCAWTTPASWTTG